MATKTKTRKAPRTTPEERQAKVDAALATLEAGVSQLVSSEAWADYLAFQARFHRYSFNNVMLIKIQRPDATKVAGFNAWKAMGRSVRKGEKGIAILAPMRRTAEDEKTGEKRSWIGGFKVEHVFDVSQTDGEPLPAHPASLLDGDGDAALMGALVAQATGAGFTVELADECDGGANGWTNFGTRTVRVDGRLPEAQRVKTMAHELAHVLMHDPADPDLPSSRGLIEVEAESVAFIVLHAMGYDAGDYSFGYVAGWAGSDVKAIQKVASRAQRTATRIIAAITES